MLTMMMREEEEKLSKLGREDKVRGACVGGEERC